MNILVPSHYMLCRTFNGASLAPDGRSQPLLRFLLRIFSRMRYSICSLSDCSLPMSSLMTIWNSALSIGWFCWTDDLLIGREVPSWSSLCLVEFIRSVFIESFKLVLGLTYTASTSVIKPRSFSLRISPASYGIISTNSLSRLDCEFAPAKPWSRSFRFDWIIDIDWETYSRISKFLNISAFSAASIAAKLFSRRS